MLVSCMSLFTKHNYRAKKLNYSTLKGKSNVNGLYLISNNVLLRAKKVGHQISVSFEKFDVVQALLSFY
jgi:hypothetical protein